jgi:phosphoglycerate dehydrogenase-like enzyme
MNKFKMVILPPEFQEEWPEKIREAVPEASVKLFRNPADAISEIADADCAFGDVVPELFANNKRLRWIQCYAAGPRASFWHEQLVRSDVVVTNFRGIYDEHVSAHAMALLLALARRLHEYIPQQQRKEGIPLDAAKYLPRSTVLVIGLGGIGSETARLAKAFGMKVIGVDPRVTGQPPGHVDEIHRPEELDALLPRADFVIMAAPETPQTTGMMDAARFARMKPSAYIVNVGRGACIVHRDLVVALQGKLIAGAGLDVFEEEPLPQGDPLWDMPNVIITPHVATRNAEHVLERRTTILIENCKRFAKGEPLINVVDKRNWF